MSAAVQFDYDTGFGAEEIGDVGANLLLAAEFDGMCTQKVIPQPLFLTGRILPQFTGTVF